MPHKYGLISSNNTVPSTKDMQVLDEQTEAYFNFINSLNSESTRKSYKFCIEKFLGNYDMDLALFLNLPQDKMTNLIIKYFVDKKISRQYKNLMSATLKHACEINDVVLNWKKIKKFINTGKTGNEANGRDRGYTHEEILKILEFCDQRIKTFFLILASTGMRMGALRFLKVQDLTKIEFTKEQQEEIDKIKKGEPMPRTKVITNKDGRSYEYTTHKRFSYEVARKRLVALYKGLCTSCGDYPAYRLSYDVGDERQSAKLIERYCEPCFRKWQNRIKK